MEIRALEPADLALLSEIDRSELIKVQYEVVDGDLVVRDDLFAVPPWNPEGTGPHSVGAMRGSLEPILYRGAVLLGAFKGDDVAGMAVVEPRFEPPMAWLTFLHVSRPYRRMGVASTLWEESVRRALEAGATSLYVSATPSGSAVGFYLSRGCVVTQTPHPDLLAEEPEDIHFTCNLGR
ncbi:MAG: GNAT family N-acetyltransferase [Acidimicrobiia bacterium]|nr:GNAT family N-acetyltransferase [Acidimicrobiia bacterium]